MVADNERDFSPLVCETLGVWSPYTLTSLFSIADNSTVYKNGLSRKSAR